MAGLKDILGKTGDFQFSFAVKDMVSPVFEKIDRTQRVMSNFFEKKGKVLGSKMFQARKFLKDFLRRDVKKTDKSLRTVVDDLEEISDGAEDVKDSLEDISDTVEDAFDFERFKTAFESFDSETGVMSAADTFADRMGHVGDALGHSRKEMLGLLEGVSQGVQDINSFAASTDEAMQAVEGLVEAGVREVETLQSLGPVVAVASRAVGEDIGSVSQTFATMSEQAGLSRDRIMDVFASWKRTSEETKAGFKDLHGTMTEPGFFKDFRKLTAGMSEDTKVNVLSSLGQIQGALRQVGADGEEFISGLMEKVTDPQFAGELLNLTGMTQEQVQKQLQTAEGAAQFFDGFMQKVQESTAGGTAALGQWAEIMGVSEKTLVELQGKSGEASEAFTKLQEAQREAGDSTKFLTGRATDNMRAVEGWGNALSHYASQTIPGVNASLMDMADVIADLPLMQIFTLGTMLTWLAGTPIAASIASFFGLQAAASAVTATVSGAAVSFGALMMAALPWIAAGAAIAGVAYLVYNHFDKIKEVGWEVYDFFMGTGPLEEGWLGTLQGFLRILLIPMKVVLFTVKTLVGALADLAVRIDEMTGISEIILGMRDAFVEVGKAIFEILRLKWETWMAGFKDTLNTNFIDPMNKFTSIGFGGVTIGSKLGIAEIPRLGDGGIVTSPMVAEVAERGPEAVVDLDRYDALVEAATLSRLPPTVRTGDTNVAVNQDKVVEALMRLERTLTRFMRSSGLPSRGSGFGTSPAASPRGF